MTAPSVLSLEVRRLERETIRRLEDLRDVFARNPEQARAVMERLLEGTLTFTPIETDDGKRYRIEGRVPLGESLQIPADPAAPYLLRPQGVSRFADSPLVRMFEASNPPSVEMRWVA